MMAITFLGTLNLLGHIDNCFLGKFVTLYYIARWLMK